MPERLHVVPGTMIVETYRPGDFSAFLRTAQRRLRTYLAAPPDIYPWPCGHCSRCDYIPVCRKRWEDDDHLTLVASIRRDHVEKLNGVGVTTLAGLAEAPPELQSPASRRRCSTRCATRPACSSTAAAPTSSPAACSSPRTSAASASCRRPRPATSSSTWRATRSSRPRGGLEFLFGVLARRPDGTTDYTAIRARDRAGERKAFEQFIDLVHARLAEHPDMHVYHYAAYEPSTLSRLDGRPRHPRGRGRRPAPPRDPRRPLPGRPPEPARRRPLLLAEGDRAVLLHPRRPTSSRATTPSSASSSTSRTATRRSSPTSRPITRRTASRRSSCATGCSCSASRPRPSSGPRSPSGCRPSSVRGRRSRPRSSRRRPACRDALLAAADGRDERWLAGAAPRLPPPRGAPGMVVVLPPVRDDRRGADRRLRGDRGPGVGRSASRSRRAVARLPVHVSAAAAPLRPGRHRGRPRRRRHELDRHRARQRRRHRRPQARQRVSRQAPPDGPRPRRPVRHEGAPGGPPSPGRLDDRRGRPLPRPAEAAPPRRAPGRRAGAADGDRGAARPRRRPRPDLPLRPGPAGVGQDVPRRPADHGAPSCREAGGGGVAEPQGDPQPARRGRAGGRRGAARLPGPEAGPGVRRAVHPARRAARVRRSRSSR